MACSFSLVGFDLSLFPPSSTLERDVEASRDDTSSTTITRNGGDCGTTEIRYADIHALFLERVETRLVCSTTRKAWVWYTHHPSFGIQEITIMK
ncbi:hypothetical protein TorRG33x02_201060 [Trema orientale]|uniref:Uncharacterized protein n=1 Tax=Trema orientale TaxID=63057 RepID=A0A2P5EF02_TREOI|nr:hypothetical protein TorRG33x02_201060 [Trema orientale]